MEIYDHNDCKHDFDESTKISTGPNILGQVVSCQAFEKVCKKCGFVEYWKRMGDINGESEPINQ